MRLAVIGDVGGHHQSLLEALIVLGVDPDDLLLPQDLVVCQVGDLVHRGPDSSGVLNLVDVVMTKNPGRWFQLAGNHEAQYLFPPRFHWPEVLADEDAAILRRWWATGQMKLAASFDTVGTEVRRPGGVREVVGEGGLLVTHAGMGPGLWSLLGMPESASAAAEAVNALRFDYSSAVWSSGLMLDGSPNVNAGVAWAESTTEVVGAWSIVGTSPDFHQAHGHSSAMLWSRMRWTSMAAHWRKSGTGPYITADQEMKIVRAEVDGQVIWGTDPGHGTSAQRIWKPLVLDLAQ